MIKRKQYLFDTPRKSDGSLHKPGVRGIHSAMNAVRQNTGSANNVRIAAQNIRNMRNSLGRKKAKVKLLKMAARYYR